jgi:FAD-dependent urate hydroxylase
VAERVALVIGGGLGGLAATLALRRAGIEAVLFEQQDDLRKIQVGGGIHMWANAMQALRHIGVDEQVAAAGAPIHRTEFQNPNGRRLTTWQLKEVADAYATEDVGIARAALQQVLIDAQDEDALRLGKRCTGFEQDADGVTARFADGSEERGALLVGADGLRSTIRTQLLGDASPRYAGYAQMQALADGAEELLPRGVERVVFGRGARAVLHHVRGGLFWAAAIYEPEGTVPDGIGRRDTVLTRLAGWTAPLEEVVSATAADGIVAFDIYDRPPVSSWSNGRVTLLGDAAHPMTTNLSQGGCQALEDGVVLADALAGEQDVARALRTYDARRVPRTSSLVKQSHAVARLGGFRNPLVCAVRDQVTKVTLSGPGYRDYRRLAAETMDGIADGAGDLSSS